MRLVIPMTLILSGVFVLTILLLGKRAENPDEAFGKLLLGFAGMAMVVMGSGMSTF